MNRKALLAAACITVLGAAGIALMANGYMGSGTLALVLAVVGLVYHLLDNWLL